MLLEELFEAEVEFLGIWRRRRAQLINVSTITKYISISLSLYKIQGIFTSGNANEAQGLEPRESSNLKDPHRNWGSVPQESKNIQFIKYYMQYRLYSNFHIRFCPCRTRAVRRGGSGEARAANKKTLTTSTARPPIAPTRTQEINNKIIHWGMIIRGCVERGVGTSGGGTQQSACPLYSAASPASAPARANYPTQRQN